MMKDIFFFNSRPSTSGQTAETVEISFRELRETRKHAKTVRQNKDRLLYYIEETNEGKGFIKVSENECECVYVCTYI